MKTYCTCQTCCDCTILVDARDGRRYCQIYSPKEAERAAALLNQQLRGIGFYTAPATEAEKKYWFGPGDGSVLVVNGAEL